MGPGFGPLLSHEMHLCFQIGIVFLVKVQRSLGGGKFILSETCALPQRLELSLQLHQ